MSRKKTYEVRVYRRYAEDYADIEVRAASIKDAEVLAEKEAKANHSLWFSDIPEADFYAEFIGDREV